MELQMWGVSVCVYTQTYICIGPTYYICVCVYIGLCFPDYQELFYQGTDIQLQPVEKNKINKLVCTQLKKKHYLNSNIFCFALLLSWWTLM